MIPTFRSSRTLETTLTSVLDQAPGPETMQIEVVDDGSDDDPETVVKAIGKGRVAFHRHSQNIGHVENFHACLTLARGEIVHLLHGDDLVRPGFYATLDAAFAAHPEIGAAFCRSVYIDGVGREIGRTPKAFATAGIVPDAAAFLASEQRIMTPSIAVRRTAYERLGGFDRRLECAEDWEMWVRIAASFPIWYEPRALAAYRIHADSNTGRHIRQGGDATGNRRAIEIFSAYLPRERAWTIQAKARRTYAASAIEVAGTLLANGDRAGFLAQMREAIRLSPQVALRHGVPLIYTTKRPQIVSANKPSSAVGVAVSGCGALTRIYALPALARLADQGLVQVRALYDPDQEAATTAARVAPGSEVVGTYEELLRNDVQLVLLAGPPSVRLSQGRAAISAGVHVFCEKPLAGTLEDAQILVDEARTAAIGLGLGLVRRQFPATCAVRWLIAGGALGAIRRVYWFEGGPFSWPVSSPDYFRATTYGGVLADLGTHVFDLLGWWFGPLTILDYSDDAMGGLEANCHIRLAAGGVEAELRLSRDWQRPNRVIIEGERGRIVWSVEDISALDIEATRDIPLGRMTLVGPRQSPIDFVGCYARQIEDFFSVMEGNIIPSVSAEAGLHAAEAVDRCLSQRRLMSMGWLSPSERAMAFQLAKGAP